MDPQIHGSGEMADLVRSHDWSRTPLGPVEHWPGALVCAVNTVLESRIPMAVCWGPAMILIYNDACVALLGEKHPQALGAPAAETWESEWPAIGPRFEAALRHGEATAQENVAIPTMREGRREEVFWTFSTIPLHGPQGEIAGLLAVFLDATGERENAAWVKRAEAALKEAEKLAAVGRLAASIAHEINNPLEAVSNLLFLAMQSANMDELQGYLRMAERELRRASIISSETLRFNRKPTNPRQVSCDELFESALFIHHGRIVNARIQVEQRLTAHTPLHCFDGEIRQVLNNLIANAIDAMQGTGGRLLVRSRETTHWPTGRKGLMLTVADTGAGIKPEHRRKIFEPFFTTKGTSGTGLGLWVSQEIAERHQGKLRMRSSQQSGRNGTVFTLFLPFEAVLRQSAA